MEIFEKQTYPYLPYLREVEGVILDIGANVGCTAIWLAALYPQAAILAFEPARETFSLLQENTRDIPNVRPFAHGLYDRDCEATLAMSRKTSCSREPI